MAVVVVLVAGAVALRARGGDPTPAERAVGLLADEARFDSSEEAVTGFASVYEVLVEAAAAFPKDCDVDAGRGRCLAINQAAGWALAFAPAAGRCTQPAIQGGRIALLGYVRTTTRLDDDADEAPPLPPVPAC